MSLILDALRKSEEEHQIQSPPPISPPFHKAKPPKPQLFNFRWFLTGVLIVLNGLLIFGIIYKPGFLPTNYLSFETNISSREKENQLDEVHHTTQLNTVTIDTNTSKHQDIPSPISSLIQAQPLSEKKAHSQNQRKKTEQTLITPTINTTPSSVHIFDTPHISSLSPEITKQLPTLRYESHWYDKHPERRAIIINSLNLKEGATLGNHINVHAITKEGCILNYKGQLFHILMLQSWPEID